MKGEKEKKVVVEEGNMEANDGGCLGQKVYHFVLVHGVGHGAWCWYKVRTLLESSGHKVTCLDLAGAGIDRSNADDILSFDDYNKPLTDFMSQLPDDEKVGLPIVTISIIKT